MRYNNPYTFYVITEESHAMSESEEKDYWYDEQLFNWSHTFAFLHLLLFVFPQSYAEVM